MRLDRDAFQRDGALKFPALFEARRVELLAQLQVQGPGARLQDGSLPALIAPATAAASKLLGAQAHPVRAVLFDKTESANWAVAWHQDRTVPVHARIEAEGFGPWSRKDGALHVAPPVEVLEGMATLRIHIDKVDHDNAPLKVAVGSHRLGKVAAADAATVARRFPELVCLAQPGDVWAYSTPILHASERAAAPRQRRVLQVDYATTDLPGGLEWAGIA